MIHGRGPIQDISPRLLVEDFCDGTGAGADGKTRWRLSAVAMLDGAMQL